MNYLIIISSIYVIITNQIYELQSKHFPPSSFILFRGVVAVSMDIMMLDIDQCPEKYYVPNAFKDTHKCDDKSSYVSSKYLYILSLSYILVYQNYSLPSC